MLRSALSGVHQIHHPHQFIQGHYPNLLFDEVRPCQPCPLSESPTRPGEAGWSLLDGPRRPQSCGRVGVGIAAPGVGAGAARFGAMGYCPVLTAARSARPAPATKSRAWMSGDERRWKLLQTAIGPT